MWRAQCWFQGNLHLLISDLHLYPVQRHWPCFQSQSSVVCCCSGPLGRCWWNELMKTWTRHHSCFVMALIIYVKVRNLLEIQPFAVVCCSYRFAYRLKWWQYNVRYRDSVQGDSLCPQTNQLLLSLSDSLLLNHQCTWQNRSREAHLPFFGYAYTLLCYLKGATGLEDFCMHISLPHLLVGVISAYSSVAANSPRYCLEGLELSHSLCTHTAQACLAGTMPSCGLHYTGDITITATTVYILLLLKSYSPQDPVLFTTGCFLFRPTC